MVEGLRRCPPSCSGRPLPSASPRVRCWFGWKDSERAIDEAGSNPRALPPGQGLRGRTRRRVVPDRRGVFPVAPVPFGAAPLRRGARIARGRSVSGLRRPLGEPARRSSRSEPVISAAWTTWWRGSRSCRRATVRVRCRTRAPRPSSPETRLRRCRTRARRRAFRLALLAAVAVPVRVITLRKASTAGAAAAVAALNVPGGPAPRGLPIRRPLARPATLQPSNSSAADGAASQDRLRPASAGPGVDGRRPALVRDQRLRARRGLHARQAFVARILDHALRAGLGLRASRGLRACSARARGAVDRGPADDGSCGRVALARRSDAALGQFANSLALYRSVHASSIRFASSSKRSSPRPTIRRLLRRTQPTDDRLSVDAPALAADHRLGARGVGRRARVRNDRGRFAQPLL